MRIYVLVLGLKGVMNKKKAGSEGYLPVPKKGKDYNKNDEQR